MNNSTKAGTTFILLTLFSLLLFSFKTNNPDCGSVKNGTFHFYKDNGRHHAIIVRRDSLQTEINTKTLDTSYWRVTWISDCEFTTTFISGTKARSQEDLDFYKQSTLKFKISNSSREFYTYHALFSYNNRSKIFSDTMWLQEK